MNYTPNERTQARTQTRCTLACIENAISFTCVCAGLMNATATEAATAHSTQQRRRSGKGVCVVAVSYNAKCLDSLLWFSESKLFSRAEARGLDFSELHLEHEYVGGWGEESGVGDDGVGGVLDCGYAFYV